MFKQIFYFVWASSDVLFNFQLCIDGESYSRGAFYFCAGWVENSFVLLVLRSGKFNWFHVLVHTVVDRPQKISDF